MKPQVKLVTQRELDERRKQERERFMEARALRYERDRDRQVAWVGIVVYTAIAAGFVGWCVYEGIGPVLHKISQVMAAFDVIVR